MRRAQPPTALRMSETQPRQRPFGQKHGHDPQTARPTDAGALRREPRSAEVRFVDWALI